MTAATEPQKQIPVGLRDRLTIVVLTHNRRAELTRSLAKLSALPEQPPIVVVDNASTDDTKDCVEAEFPQVQLVQATSNMGAAGRNLGVERVSTPYVAFSDDDTWWAPDALREAADILDTHPSIAVLNARIVVGAVGAPDPACEVMAHSPLEEVAGVGPMLIGFMAGAVVMRAQVYREAGGYWPPFFIGGEETLLSMDILDAGHHIVYAPALQVHHWPSPQRDSVSRRRFMARNAIWTAWMRLPARVAASRSTQTLRCLAGNDRLSVINESLTGAGPVLRRRRVLRPATCALLARVWQHEAV